MIPRQWVKTRQHSKTTDIKVISPSCGSTYKGWMRRKTKKHIKFIAAERRIKCGQQWYLTVSSNIRLESFRGRK